MRLVQLHRRDMAVAVALGSAVALFLNAWFNVVAKPTTVDDWLWLAQLQEPGARAGEWLAHRLLPVTGYPWNVRCGTLCGYTTLALLWGVIFLVGIVLGRAIALVLRSMRRRTSEGPATR